MHFVNFGVSSMSPDLLTEAVAIIINLKFLIWLRDATHFVNFGICNTSSDSPTETVAVITDLDCLDWL